MAGRLVVEVGWRRCCLETAGSELARWGMLFSGARWSRRADPAGSHLRLCRPTPVAGYIATYRMYHANTRTALLELYVLTDPRRLADCGVFHVCFSFLLSWGEIPYVLLSGLPRRHLFRPFLYNRILALPRICVVTSVTAREDVTLVSVA
jgi:hypothetical protein